MKKLTVILAFGLALAALNGSPAIAKDRGGKSSGGKSSGSKGHNSGGGHHSGNSHSGGHCKAGDYFWDGGCHSFPKGGKPGGHSGGGHSGGGSNSSQHSGGHCKAGDFFWGGKCHSFPRGGYRLAPKSIYHGNAPWNHWHHNHVHPTYHVYSWNWVRLNSVTCTAEDSYGDLFPVTETGYAGSAYQPILSQVQDAAMDYCFDETGGDYGCHLVSCTPYYY